MATEQNTLTTKTLSKAASRGKGAFKETFPVTCWPKGNGETFISNAVAGLGIGFVVRAISQTLAIDCRSAFVAGKDMKSYRPNADGTASSGDGYAPLRRDLRKAGVPETEIEGIVEMAKSKAVPAKQ